MMQNYRIATAQVGNARLSVRADLGKLRGIAEVLVNTNTCGSTLQGYVVENDVSGVVSFTVAA